MALPSVPDVRDRNPDRVRDRIERICRSTDDPLALRLAVLAELRQVVPFDAHVWLLTDPETSVGASPLADLPAALLPELPRLIRLKYLSETNRWTGLAGRAVRLSDPPRSRVWREMLHGYGTTDVASAVFRDRYGCWGMLDLWRAGGVFTPTELSFVDSVTEVATAALRRCQAATFSATSRPPVRPGPVVLLLSSLLEVRAQTPDVSEYLRRLVPPSEGRAPVPASAYNVAAQLLAVEEGVDANSPSARVHLADGRWLSLRAARLGPGDQIAVTIEDASPVERLGVFTRAFGLSARETELVEHLRTGADTRELADRMHLSQNTVQDHLKSIFSKTGSRNRRTLLSRALGTA